MSLPIGTLLLVASVLTSGTSSEFFDNFKISMSSIEYEPIDGRNDEVEELFFKEFTLAIGKKFVKIGKDKVVVLEKYLNFAQEIEDMEVKNDDIWVVSHPKTGTTWTQEMVWCIVNNMDLETAKKIPQDQRFPFLEGVAMIAVEGSGPEVPPALDNSVQRSINQPSPRFIKTHLQWSMLPSEIRTGQKKPKIIYVARNAKDTCVSYYHHCLIIAGYRGGNLDNFCKFFMANLLPSGPFWIHVLEFWKRREDNNILFIKYEDMKKDLPAVIRLTASFLNKILTEDQVAVLADHLSFENMKNNPAVNKEETVQMRKRQKNIQHTGHFIRSGQVGGWEKEMSPQITEEFDKWTEENLRNSDLQLEESKRSKS